MPLDNPQVGTTQHTPKPHLLLLFWLRNILTKMLIVGEVGNMTESRRDSGFVLYTPLPWPNQLPFPHPRRCPTPQITASWAHLTSAHKNTHTITITITICAHEMLRCFQLPRSLNYKVCNSKGISNRRTLNPYKNSAFPLGFWLFFLGVVMCVSIYVAFVLRNNRRVVANLIITLWLIDFFIW